MNEYALNLKKKLNRVVNYGKLPVIYHG